MANKAIGMIETQGLVTLLEASDAAIKAANVTLSGWDKVGSGMVTAFFSGDVASVKTAVDAAAEAGSKLGNVIAIQVIAQPHEDLGILGKWMG